MLKIPKIPNPVSMAIDNYKMTNLGKIVVGSMVAQAVTSMIGNSYEREPVRTPSSPRSYDEMAEDETRNYLVQLAEAVNRPDIRDTWATLNTQQRRQWFVDSFNNSNRSHLISYLMKELDEHLPVILPAPLQNNQAQNSQRPRSLADIAAELEQIQKAQALEQTQSPPSFSEITEKLDRLQNKFKKVRRDFEDF